MPKKTLIIVLTAASISCAWEPVSLLNATDQSWVPMERDFVAGIFIALIITTLLLWVRIRWALAPAVAAHAIFGFYFAWPITGTIRSGNYSGPAALVLLVCMGLCPFLAALAAAIWSSEFYQRRTNVA